MWEVAYCVDKEWAKKYIKKAKQYYEKRFSYALDRAIGNAKGTFSIYNPEKKGEYYNPKEMMLNSDVEKLVYENCKDLYEQCINRPDFSNRDMKYFYSELGNCHL